MGNLVCRMVVYSTDSLQTSFKSGRELVVGVLDIYGQLLADSVDEHGIDVIRTIGDPCELDVNLHGVTGVIQPAVDKEALQALLFRIEGKRNR